MTPLALRPLELLRWLPLELRATPGLLLALAATASAWGVIWILFQYGLSSNSSFGGSAPREMAFLSGTVGAAVACHLLGRRAWLLEQLAERERKVGVLLVLFVVTLAFQLAGAALPASLSSGGGGGWIPGLLGGGLLSSFHWAALGLVVLAWPLSPAARTALLLLLGWWLPALLAGAPEGFLAPRLRWILDPSRYLVGPNGPAATPGASLVDMAPAAALLLVAASLPFHTRRKR